MGDNLFTSEYLEHINEASVKAARVIAPHVMEWIKPSSVVDVGCGRGAWLSVLGELGVHDVQGLDGEYVDKHSLMIPEARFAAADLNEPPAIDRSFDLAMSFEVVQYLPPARAEHFVRFLADLSDVILFSSAVPGQPGRDHKNPQWPSYWHQLFAAQGYEAFDPIRPLVWHDERVALHYRQNMYMYVSQEALRGPLQHLAGLPKANCLTLVDEDTVQGLTGLRSSLFRILYLLLKPFRRA